MRGNLNILVGDEDLESADDLSKRNRFVGLPLLCRLHILNEDDEVLVLALVVDLGLWYFSTSHDCGFWFFVCRWWCDWYWVVRFVDAIWYWCRSG